jgi:NAD(P)H-flavin reductase
VSAFRLVKEIIYESAQTRILVVSCFKNINETFLREDFSKLSLYWCLKHHMFLSQDVEPENPPQSGENFHNERLDSENFKQLMRDLKFFDPKLTQVLISGREGFIESTKKIVKENSYKRVASI